MSDQEISKSNSMLTFLGSLGAMLIFVLILFIAYLPNRPDPVDTEVVAARQAKADEARAAGLKKLTSLELDEATGTVRMPIDAAMDQTLAAYQSSKRVVKTGQAVAQEVESAAGEAAAAN